MPFPNLQTSPGSSSSFNMPKAAKRTSEEYHSQISVIVKSQDGRQMYFKINRSTPFQKLFTAYCQRVNVEYKTMQFVFNGYHIPAKRTPQQLGIEEGDEIDALTHQTGGGCCKG